MPTRSSSSKRLDDSVVLPLTPDLRRLVTRLSKPCLCDIAQGWLTKSRYKLFNPTLTTPDDEILTLAGAQEVYASLQNNKAIKRGDVAKRILTHEFRAGLSLLAIAELELAYLLTHTTCLTWRTFLLSSSSPPSASHNAGLRFYPPTLASSLRSHIVPAATPYVHHSTHPSLPVTLVRVSLHDFGQPLTYPDASKIFWLALPHGGQHIFTNLGIKKEGSLLEMVMNAIQESVSEAGRRWELQKVAFIAHSLEAMVAYKGAEAGQGGMVGGWGMYIKKDEKGEHFEGNPLKPPEDITIKEEAKRKNESEEEAELRKRRKLVSGRFGDGTLPGVESISFTVEEKYPPSARYNEVDEDEEDDDDDDWAPKIGVRLEGTDVFGGVRELAEAGVFDIAKMPGWLTGEEGVTSGTVKDGKVVRGASMRVGQRFTGV